MRILCELTLRLSRSCAGLAVGCTVAAVLELATVPLLSLLGCKGALVEAASSYIRCDLRISSLLAGRRTLPAAPVGLACARADRRAVQAPQSNMI